MRYSAVSASIVMVRKMAQPSTSQLDYELLFLKRAESTYAGGTFAFPGGKVERQDYLETWKATTPNYFTAPFRFGIFHDFNKRQAAIRETFEECNLLLVKPENENRDLESKEWFGKSRADFETNYKDDFSGFCKKSGLVPQLDKLYAYRRMATPYGAPSI